MGEMNARLVVIGGSDTFYRVILELHKSYSIAELLTLGYFIPRNIQFLKDLTQVAQENNLWF